MHNAVKLREEDWCYQLYLWDNGPIGAINYICVTMGQLVLSIIFVGQWANLCYQLYLWDNGPIGAINYICGTMGQWCY